MFFFMNYFIPFLHFSQFFLHSDHFRTSVNKDARDERATTRLVAKGPPGVHPGRERALRHPSRRGRRSKPPRHTAPTAAPRPPPTSAFSRRRTSFRDISLQHFLQVGRRLPALRRCEIHNEGFCHFFPFKKKIERDEGQRMY